MLMMGVVDINENVFMLDVFCLFYFMICNFLLV